MMKHATDRRTVLVAAAAATVAAAAGAAAAQSMDIRGAVKFEGGADIPEGQVKIYFEDPANQDDVRQSASETRVSSDGKSKTIAFSFSLPASAAVSPTSEIVALLERADGWLLARGSTQFEAGAPIFVILNRAIY